MKTGSNGFCEVKGVILNRKPSGENNLWSTLFLEGIGIMNLLSKNLRGDSEPFIWGYFELKQFAKSSKYFLYEADIKELMKGIRRGIDPLKVIFKWRNNLIRYLVPEQPDDELLAILYWNMKMLADNSFSHDAVDWRFMWQWLTHWGLAPDIADFLRRGGFSREEALLLAQTTIVNEKGMSKLFSNQPDANIRTDAFKKASEMAGKYFIQK